MRYITIRTRPETTFQIPQSDGYLLYSALLSTLEDDYPELSQTLHDAETSTFHSSGLLGDFDNSTNTSKTVNEHRVYKLNLGITHPREKELTQALGELFAMSDTQISLPNGDLNSIGFVSENESHEDLVNRARDLNAREFSLTFNTPTCILEDDDITTLLPHRRPVFTSLLSKWNQTAPTGLQLPYSGRDIEENVIETNVQYTYPDPKKDDGIPKHAKKYKTHNVIAKRIHNADGSTYDIKRHGFTGTITYGFRGASPDMQNKITALGLYSEYSGVGSAVARGCGNTIFDCSN